MDNGEVRQEKGSMKPSELFGFMQERMHVLASTKPELAGELANKLYAGVCADFAKLTLAMLREAGIASGLVSGLRPHGVSVTTADAHGLVFVPVPSERADHYNLIQIDGTPGGITDAEKA